MLEARKNAPAPLTDAENQFAAARCTSSIRPLAASRSWTDVRISALVDFCDSLPTSTSDSIRLGRARRRSAPGGRTAAAREEEGPKGKAERDGDGRVCHGAFQEAHQEELGRRVREDVMVPLVHRSRLRASFNMRVGPSCLPPPREMVCKGARVPRRVMCPQAYILLHSRMPPPILRDDACKSDSSCDNRLANIDRLDRDEGDGDSASLLGEEVVGRACCALRWGSESKTNTQDVSACETRPERRS
jgi:hypothetical protein